MLRIDRAGERKEEKKIELEEGMAVVIPEIFELGRGGDSMKKSQQQHVQVVEEIVKIEKKIFPKHESLAKSFHDELKKKNSGLLYTTATATQINGEKEEVEIAGYVMYTWTSSLCASITKLAVKENYRRQGHGEALLKAAIQKCRTRNIQRVCLHVDPSRTAAVTLYSKFGFQFDKLIEKYYSSDRDAYRMYLEFTDV